MVFFAYAVPLIAALATASPLEHRAWSAVGASTSDPYPPSGTSVDTAAFPAESVVGYYGATPTGAEPFAIQTAPAFPVNTKAMAPLVVPTVGDTPIYKRWGNLSPMGSVDSSQYGLFDASPIAPDQCDVTQVHILFRHGARYPSYSSDGTGPAGLAAALKNASQSADFKAKGSLAFLNTWNYKLGTELLTPYGRQQNFELGIQSRMLYGHLLNNFTEAGTLPVFRTESQDRMIKTALNFAAGFFGVPEMSEQFNLQIGIEASGFNYSGAPYETCTNINAPSGQIGTKAANQWAAHNFRSTAERLNKEITGFTWNTTYVLEGLQLCAYETVALGYSAFCNIFTAEDFDKFEHYYDISFFYNFGFGGPVSAAQGKGWVEEFVARLTHDPITSSDSSLNVTLDTGSSAFPLNQSIYADASHEVVIHAIVAALNLTGTYGGKMVPYSNSSSFDKDATYIASNIVPFAGRLVAQVLECAPSKPTKQIRFILNDAVVPIDNFPYCDKDPNGLCAYDNVVKTLKERLDDIDYEYACFGNFTAEIGHDYNGLPPKKK